MSSPQKEKLTLMPYSKASPKFRLHASLKNKLWQFASIRTLKDAADEKNQNTGNVQVAASFVHLKHKEYANYTSELGTVNPQILLSGRPAGSETYQEVLGKALANYFGAKLLVFDGPSFLRASSTEETEFLKDGSNTGKFCVCFEQIPVITVMAKGVNWSAGEADKPISSSNAPSSSVIDQLMWAASGTTGPQSSGTAGPQSTGSKRAYPFGDEESEERKQEEGDIEKKDVDRKKEDKETGEEESKKEAADDEEDKVVIYKKRYGGEQLFYILMRNCHEWKDLLQVIHPQYVHWRGLNEPEPDFLDYPKTVDDLFPGWEVQYMGKKKDGTGFVPLPVDIENTKDNETWHDFSDRLHHILVVRHSDEQGGEEKAGDDNIPIFDISLGKTEPISFFTKFTIQLDSVDEYHELFGDLLFLEYNNCIKDQNEIAENVKGDSLDRIWPGYKNTYWSYRGTIFDGRHHELRPPKTVSGWRFFMKFLGVIVVKPDGDSSTVLDIDEDEDGEESEEEEAKEGEEEEA